MKQSKDINVQIRYDWEYAKRTILNEGELPNHFIIHTKHGPVTCLVQWETDDQKFMALAQIRLIFAGLDGIALSFFCEAWCADCSPDMRPSQAPNRIEIVQSAIFYRDDADEWHVQHRRDQAQSRRQAMRYQTNRRLGHELGARCLPKDVLQGSHGGRTPRRTSVCGCPQCSQET
jgi:hypothetical protein